MTLALALISAQISRSPVEITMKVLDTTVIAGTVPRAEVRIKNISKASIVVSFGEDGSYEGRRYPHVVFCVRRGEQDWAYDAFRDCGNMNLLDASSFRVLKSGEEALLAQTQSHPFYRLKPFDQPGVVDLKFVYDSSSLKVYDWQGDDRGRKPGPEVTALFEKSIKGRWETPSVAIQVKPRTSR